MLFNTPETDVATLNWKPTREAGLQRLEDFAPFMGRAYASKRNFDYGSDNRSNVSALSSWVSHRLITEQDILSLTDKHHSFSSAEKFIQEVFWRGYFKGWLEQHPSVWTAYKSNLKDLVAQLDNDKFLSQDYAKAISGDTGIECFDAWSQELIDTGYLHNHTRMWFASIWIFTLKLPWELGADFFYRHLLDGDAASNTLSWRWVAGLHTKGKTYLARPSNIARYTEDRFNPVGQLASEAHPLIEAETYPLTPMPQSDLLLPQDQRVGLVVTEEDCSSETLFADLNPQACLGLTNSQGRSSLPTHERVIAFTHGAITDALKRCVQTYKIETSQQDSSDWSDTLLSWAQDHELKCIVTSYAPVGPIADQLALAKSRLQDANVDLVQIIRPYDIKTWPHATKGFFKLKTKIPKILSELGC